jgi:hypothetical protein
MKPVRILLTTTSYQDIPGAHHELPGSAGIEIVREPRWKASDFKQAE